MISLVFFFGICWLGKSFGTEGFVEKIFNGGECVSEELFLSAFYKYGKCCCYTVNEELECVKYVKNGERVEEKKYKDFLDCEGENFFEENSFPFDAINSCDVVADYNMAFSRFNSSIDHFVAENPISSNDEVLIGFNNMKRCKLQGLGGDENWVGIVKNPKVRFQTVNFECPGYQCIEIGKNAFIQVSCGYSWKKVINHEGMVYRIPGKYAWDGKHKDKWEKHGKFRARDSIGNVGIFLVVIGFGLIVLGAVWLILHYLFKFYRNNNGRAN